MNKQVSFAFFAWTVLTPCFGQLYLIAGSPSPKYNVNYSTVLVAIGTDGSVKVSQEIVPSKVGTEWMTVSNDSRKALILPKYPDGEIMVFDLDTASIAKSCQQPKTDLLLVNQWLLDSPSRGLVFVQYLGSVNRQSSKDQFLGMLVDSAVPCQNSFVNLDPSELKYVVSNGVAGVADLGANDRMGISMSKDGKLQTKWLSGAETIFDYQMPPIVFDDMKHPAASILFNNQQVLGLELADSPSRHLMVLRKSDSTWHEDPEPSPGRAFGSIIVASETKIKAKGSARESAGKAEWRKGNSSTGPSVAFRLDESPLAYPGALRLYDTNTERLLTITTNQGDSEFLLVDGPTVYYRVSNRLYSAQVTEKGIGAATLLATDDLIRDAHWAFIKR